MTESDSLKIAMFEGDGIGPEAMSPCLDLLGTVTDRIGGPGLAFHSLPAGAGCYREAGEALPAESLAAARDADAILLAAAGLPSIRYPDGAEIAPQIDLRMELDLYAGVRAVQQVAGLPAALADPRAKALDFVLIRESTEGLGYPPRFERASAARIVRRSDWRSRGRRCLPPRLLPTGDKQRTMHPLKRTAPGP